MIQNYLKTAFRNFFRHKGYSFINVAGLAVGMVACVFILLWVQDELSFDNFHENIDNLYLVGTWNKFGAQIQPSSGSPPALSPALKDEYPEILNSARITSGAGDMFIRYKDKHLTDEVRFGDSSVFEMFTFPFIRGNPKNSLDDPHSIVMSEEMAAKYFGAEDPIGKIVTLDNQFDCKVMGVFENIPENSTLQFDCLASLKLMRELFRKDYIDTWYNCSFITIAQLGEGVDSDQVSQKIKGRIRVSDEDTLLEPFLYPIKNLHLKGFMGYGGNLDQVRMFVIIALLILFIACINFMNLTTARSGNRAKEVGMRKVVGAQRRDIIRQFFGESILLSFISFIFAIILVLLFLPAFRSLSGKSLSLAGNTSILGGLIGIVVLAGILSGSYPALMLSSFKPVKVLRGTLKSGPKGSLFRKVLVVVQFSVSIALIIGTIIVYKQIIHLKNRNIGLNHEHVVYVPVRKQFEATAEIARNELLQNPDILHAALSSHVPTGVYWNGTGWDWEGRTPDIDPLVTYLGIGQDYLNTFQMEVADGRFYTEKSLPNTMNVVINENFAKIMGQESPVGKRLSHNDEGTTEIYQIIGVIKDFHFKPLTREMGPIVLFYHPDWMPMRYIFMRFKSDYISQVLSHLEKVYKKYNPDFPFEYHFLDEDYDRLYRSQQRLGKIVNNFAALAIFISCLGLFGLASYMAEQRTKEIGVRKVLGASVSNIVILLTKEFTKWVLVANIIAWPIAFFVMRNWLKNYPYKASIGFGEFIFTGLAALLIALFTVSYQAVKTALSNPADSLKYE